MIDIEETLKEIQDKVVPHLDSYEQAIYHYIFRHTFLEGCEDTLFSTRNAEIGFGSGDSTKKPSWKTRSTKLKSLEAKGFAKIIERSNKGMRVKVFLPSELPFLQVPPQNIEEIDLDDLDFYKDRRLLEPILEREGHRCFYTGKKITPENCYLDHVIPQSKGGNNSYRNVVATSFDANSLKNDRDALDFARFLYREELISAEEFSKLREKIQKLQEGALVPSENCVASALGR